MKTRLIVIVLCLLMVVLGVRAQDNAPEWRLKTPTAGEYLQTIVEIAPSITPNYADFSSLISLNKVASALFYLFPDAGETGFQVLLDAYNAVQAGKRDGLVRGEWVERMIAAWINEHHIDLSHETHLQFDDFYVNVLPRDFNGDGINEYVLDAIKGKPVDRKSCVQDAEVVAYYLVQQTPDGYRFVETGLPWKGFPPSGRYSYSDGSMVELGFEDLNADGLPEWLILVGGETYGGPGMGYVDGGGLLVLEWRGGGLHYLVPVSYADNVTQGEITTNFLSEEALCDAGPYPQTVSWDFKNVDDDAPLEILQAQRYINNWDCERTETQIFDWNPDTDRYSYASTQVQYAETSQNCAQQTAEESMWEGNYGVAIRIFEQALTLVTRDLSHGVSFNYDRSLNQYLTARLAFAYLMTGHNELAASTLESLSAESPEEVSIGHFIEALHKAQTSGASPLQTCITVYKVFTTNFPEIRVGYTGDDRYYNGYNPYQPEKMGCDAPSLLKQVLSAASVPTTLFPMDYLNSLGVNSLKSIPLDTDHGTAWLIWSDVPGVEILFSPNGDTFQMSYPVLDPFLRSLDIRGIQLPGDKSGIMTISEYYPTYSGSPWFGAYSMDFGGMQGPAPCILSDGTNSTISYVGVFQLEESDFRHIFSSDHCGTSLDTVLSTNQIANNLHLNLVDCLNDFCTESTIHQEIYGWDAEKTTYVRTDLPEQTPQPPTVPEVSPTPASFPPDYDALNAFDKRDFKAVLEKTPETFALISDYDLNAQLGDYYLRALSLEALNRPEEALAEYVAIYEAAPESAWGRLARLHLECIDGCE